VSDETLITHSTLQLSQGFAKQGAVTMRAYDSIKAERGITLESPDFLDRSRQLLSKNNSIEICMSGSSMRPTIEDGDMVTLEVIQEGRINQGDIILYQSRFETAVIHRVIRIDRSVHERMVITRGDASSQNDPAIPINKILGRVKHIERAGESVKMSQPMSRFSAWLSALKKRIMFWSKA
jgi:signal peptidase I